MNFVDLQTKYEIIIYTNLELQKSFPKFCTPQS